MNKHLMLILGTTLLLSTPAKASEQLCNTKNVVNYNQLMLSEANFTKARANMAYGTLIKLKNESKIGNYEKVVRDLVIIEGYLLKSQAMKNKQKLPEFCSFLTTKL